MVKSTPRVLARLRKLCLALLESQEVEAWGEPTFRIRKKGLKYSKETQFRKFILGR